MDFYVPSSYNNMSLPTNAPMGHKHPEPHHFSNQYPTPNTSVHTHHNLPDFYQLPQQQQQQQPIDYFEDQLDMPAPVPSVEATKDNKKKPKRKQVKNACGKYNNGPASGSTSEISLRDSLHKSPQ